ncbi:MAG: YaiI/YqxD family protein [Thermomicrobiales bacterium]|nr:YaiI/YqxD family protein [Thermomicrobiales bacterium]
MPTIYLDADACPVKEQVYRVAARYEMPLIVVANSSLRIPEMAGLHARMMVVPGAMDAADDWIVEQVGREDLVLTADILLAQRTLENGVRTLDFRGNEFSPTRIGDAVAARDMAAMMRSMGLPTDGPAPFSQKDRGKFASLLDNAVSKMDRMRQRQEELR